MRETPSVVILAGLIARQARRLRHLATKGSATRRVVGKAGSSRSFLARILLAAFLAGGAAYAAAEARQEAPVPSPPQRVLFVGNSLTYYGNFPAVFSALAEANGTSVVSDMIVAPGATLTQRLSDGSVARALKEKEYTTLVLQERGGDFICAFGPDSCVQAREAIKALAVLARERGVQAMLMGSYQRLPEISRTLVEAESSAATEAGIGYIEVSGKLQRLIETAPELTWFGDDGQHPGKHLALLNAILVYEAVLGSYPDPGPLAVKAPIYGSNTGLEGALRQADAPPPMNDTPGEVRYSSETLGKLLGALCNAGKGKIVDNADWARALRFRFCCGRFAWHGIAPG